MRLNAIFTMKMFMSLTSIIYRNQKSILANESGNVIKIACIIIFLLCDFLDVAIYDLQID